MPAKAWPSTCFRLTTPTVLSSEGVVTVLANQLQARPEEVALVLDDYHLIESESIHEGMAFLLGHLPPQLHVVITSRSDPPLPLARLRARGQLVELRAADLRFTPEEASALLREVWGLDLAAEGIAALDARTEGWAVGLQLAALSLRERPDPHAFLGALAGTHRYVLDYLSEEVLERQPDRMRASCSRPRSWNDSAARSATRSLGAPTARSCWRHWSAPTCF